MRTSWQERTEAEHFAKVIRKKNQGISPKALILETKATNTGENIRFGYDLLKKKKMLPDSMILVQKPYMERRTYATFMRQWPNVQTVAIQVSSPHLNFEEYCNKEQPVEVVISMMVGDLERIMKYPSLGYQIPQKVPLQVLSAYDFLVKEDYDNHLLQQ